MEQITIDKLYNDNKGTFELTLLAGGGGLDKVLESREVQRPSMALMGWMKGFAHKRIQILGRTEMSYLQSIPKEELSERIIRLFNFDMPCVIVSKGIMPPPVILEIADKKNIPLFSSKLATVDLMNRLANWLDIQFAPKVYVHGTMVDVYGVGMLYTGKSGIGKSECALDLVERGHRLVADDAVELRKHSDNVLIASGTNLLGHHMEIRGVGIIDLERLFGVRAIRMQKRVELEVRLVMWEELPTHERLGLEMQTNSFLGVEIPMVTIPVSPGKNLTAISEVIAMNFMLKLYGENLAQTFVERLNEEIKRKSLIREYLKEDVE
ncbi:HPr(Ser) kinase/phosphatase [bacterium]|nr:MAG: HPr(Ser) kinase/phosphatase [bacterium]